MPPVLLKLKHRILHSQTREVVWNVLKFMEQEAEQGSFTIPISKANERTEAATGVTVRTVQKIKSEGKSLVTTDHWTRKLIVLNSKRKKETAKEMSQDSTSLICA
jgi:hypothetical protein